MFIWCFLVKVTVMCRQQTSENRTPADLICNLVYFFSLSLPRPYFFFLPTYHFLSLSCSPSPCSSIDNGCIELVDTILVISTHFKTQSTIEKKKERQNFVVNVSASLVGMEKGRGEDGISK